MLNQEVIVQGCIDGDRRSQQSLYEYFYGKMMVVCMRYAKDQDQALDIFQEAFIKVFNNLHKFENNGSFEGWVRRIMVNSSIDHIRKNKKHNQMVELDDVHGSIQIEEDETDELLENVSFQDMLDLMQKLSPAYKNVFNLYIVDGYTHKEIANLLDISIGTSKSNLSKAKINLRKLLNKKLERMVV